jgi:hypothetical protein
MVGLVCIILGLLVAVAVWVQGIDSMHKNYPDYKGEDLFGEETKLQCKDCNDNLTDCTCIEDTIDMKQTPGKETADYIDRHVVEAMVEVAKQKMYSEEEVIDIAKQAFVLGKDFGLIGTFSEWFEQFRKK